MKKRIYFWTDLLIDFWRVLGMVLGDILALNIHQKSIEKLSNILIDFFHGFLIGNASQMGCPGDPKIETFRGHFVTLSPGSLRGGNWN